MFTGFLILAVVYRTRVPEHVALDCCTSPTQARNRPPDFIERNQLLSHKSYNYSRKFREVMEVQKHFNNLNRNDGFRLRFQWKSLWSNPPVTQSQPSSHEDDVSSHSNVTTCNSPEVAPCN
ncbi:hypothetical protein Trydic_g3223 [Trypoxylus dichotomus]